MAWCQGRAGGLVVGRCQMSWGLFVGHLRVIHYLALAIERLMKNTPSSLALRILSPKNRSVNYSME